MSAPETLQHIAREMRVMGHAAGCADADNCTCGVTLLREYADRIDRHTGAEAVAYLANGMRFKLAATRSGAAAEFRSFPPELAGQWVALVDATDGKHLNATAPPPSPDAAVREAFLSALDDYVLAAMEFRAVVFRDEMDAANDKKIKARAAVVAMYDRALAGGAK